MGRWRACKNQADLVARAEAEKAELQRLLTEAVGRLGGPRARLTRAASWGRFLCLQAAGGGGVACEALPV